MATTDSANSFNSSLFYVSELDNKRDPVRSTKWRLIIPGNILTIIGNYKLSNGKDSSTDLELSREFAVGIQGFTMPQIQTTAQKLMFMGFESNFPTGQSNLASTTNVTINMFEDMRSYEYISSWNQSCYNTGVLEDENKNNRTAQSGLKLGLGTHKDNITNEANRHDLLRSDVKFQLYNWANGNIILECRLINAWPSTVGSVSAFNYATNANLVTFQTTFTYDRFKLFIPKQYNATWENTGTGRNATPTA